MRSALVHSLITRLWPKRPTRRPPLEREAPRGILASHAGRRIVHLVPGYFLVLIAAEILTCQFGPQLGSFLYGALLLLFLLHATVCREEPFGRIPLTLSLAPAGQLFLILQRPASPYRYVALGLPALATIVLILHYLGRLPLEVEMISGRALLDSLRWYRRTFRSLVKLLQVRLSGLRSRISPVQIYAASLRTRLNAHRILQQPIVLPRASLPFIAVLASILAIHSVAAQKPVLQEGPRPMSTSIELMDTLGISMQGVPYSDSRPENQSEPSHRRATASKGPRRKASQDQPYDLETLKSPDLYETIAQIDSLKGELLTAREPNVGGKADRPIPTQYPRGANSDLSESMDWIRASVDTWYARGLDKRSRLIVAPSPTSPPAPTREVRVNSPPFNQTVGHNPYPRGQCTWYAKERRPDLPWFSSGLGNAANWAYAARLHGFLVDQEPAVGAVVVFPPGANWSHPVLGHVAYVEETAEDYLLISECNVDYSALCSDLPRWWEAGRACGYRRIPWDELDGGVQFIHGKGTTNQPRPY